VERSGRRDRGPISGQALRARQFAPPDRRAELAASIRRVIAEIEQAKSERDGSRGEGDVLAWFAIGTMLGLAWLLVFTSSRTAVCQ
jgi:hypothetical protein